MEFDIDLLIIPSGACEYRKKVSALKAVLNVRA